jgi:hypothetical protein
MRLAQEIRFVLQLSLSESYIHGTASVNGKSFSINIQQATDQFIVLPRELADIGESNRASVSFGRHEDNNSVKITMVSGVQIGQGDIIEVYLSQDNLLLSLANDLPVEMTLRTPESIVNN